MKSKAPMSSRFIPAGFVVLAMLFGCRTAEEARDTADTSKSWEYDRGPVAVTVTIDSEEISIADRLLLTLTADVDENYDLVMPGIDPESTGFGIVDYSDAAPVLVEQGVIRYVRTFELEPFLSGTYTIGELTFEFSNTDNTTDVHELVTEPIEVIVNSMLPEDMAGLELRDVSGPVTPRSNRPVIIAVVSGGLLLVAGIASWVVIAVRRRKRRETVVTVPAHDIAFDELQALIEEDLLGDGRITEFYVRVSGILRHYIENRFGIHAPERTTEEFLLEAGRSSSLSAEYRRELSRFLEHCDLVKFADLEPVEEQIQATFDGCRDFIQATRCDEARVVVAREV